MGGPRGREWGILNRGWGQGREWGVQLAPQVEGALNPIVDAQIRKAELEVEGQGTMILLAQLKVQAGRASILQSIDDGRHQALAVALALRTWKNVDMDVRGVDTAPR